MTYALYPSLRDRLVFVSGGSSGIGAEIGEEKKQPGETLFARIEKLID